MRKLLTILSLVFSLAVSASPVVPHPKPLPIDASLWSPSGLLISFHPNGLQKPPVCSGHKVYPGMNGSDQGFVQTGMEGVYINQSNGTPFLYTLVPGDTITLKSSDIARTYFALSDIHGTPTCPIIVINEGGAARVQAISLTSCTYVKVLGTGFPGVFYGLDMTTPGGGSGQSIRVDGRSKCIEVSNLYSYKQGYGAWIKQDASCTDSISYLMGSSANWIIDSVDMHDCKFVNVGQDCIYAGTTVGTSSCGGVTHYPLHISHVNLYNLIIDSCNRTAIQVSRGRFCSVHDCTISRCGYEIRTDQGVGIAVGGMSFEVHVYNNTVKDTWLPSLETLGKGRNYFENNTVDSAGFLEIASFIDIDSLIAQKDIEIHSTNSLWNTGFYHLRKSGRWIINNYVQPAGFTMQPDNDVNLDPYLDSSTVVLRNNKFGATVVVDGSWNYVGGNLNKIVLNDFNKNPYGWYNYICGNTLLDAVTPANIAANGKHYFTDCSGFDAGPAFHFTFKIPAPSRLKRKHIN
jgi:hypothetical protein